MDPNDVLLDTEVSKLHLKLLLLLLMLMLVLLVLFVDVVVDVVVVCCCGCCGMWWLLLMMLEMMLLLMVLLVWMCDLLHAKRVFHVFCRCPSIFQSFPSPFATKNEPKKISKLMQN